MLVLLVYLCTHSILCQTMGGNRKQGKSEDRLDIHAFFHSSKKTKQINIKRNEMIIVS